MINLILKIGMLTIMKRIAKTGRFVAEVFEIYKFCFSSTFLNFRDMSSKIQTELRKIALVFLTTTTSFTNVPVAESAQLSTHPLQIHTSNHMHQ